MIFHLIQQFEQQQLSALYLCMLPFLCSRSTCSSVQILPHGSYLINLASPDAEMVGSQVLTHELGGSALPVMHPEKHCHACPVKLQAQKGYNGFLMELQRCERLGLKMYNFHPGSTTGLCTHEESMDRIAGASPD